MSDGPFSIKHEFVRLNVEHQTCVEKNDATLFRRLKEMRQDFQLISYFEFDCDWDTWEIHPRGEEIIILMEGKMKVIFENDAHITLGEFGEYAIVPQNTWHTAKVIEKSRVIVVTPGTQTKNKPVLNLADGSI